VIETFALTKRFGETVALDQLSLRAEAGEIFGFLGPNGSGKTTTIKLLMGFLRPTSGRATILGRDCHEESVALKREVGFLPDEPFLYPHLTGLELLAFVAGLHGFRGAGARERAAALAERFGLPREGRTFVATYSYGTRKRLALAAALVHEPRVLILDEPTNGLDPQAAREMRETLAALARGGRTIFLSTHLLDAAERVCHRVAILKAGRLRAIGAPPELRAGWGLGAEASLEELFLRVTSA
jgi:ABC-2 type transport system ATP-binding protein